MPTWQDVLDLDGFSSAKNRGLLNRAVSTVPNARILEVGSHFGSTAAAMCFGNDVECIHLVDNQSEFGSTLVRLAENVRRFDLPATIHDLDYFAPLPPDTFSGVKFNVYHYDGPHGEEQHASELAIAWPHLADSFLYVVDDYSWEQVHRGCEAGIAALGGAVSVRFRERYESNRMNDTDGYWNGVLMMWCVKTE
jgi:hypothetical protein